MREYKRIIILSAVLLVSIALITLSMIYDVDLKLFKNLSISGIQAKKQGVEKLIVDQSIEQVNNMTTKSELLQAKNQFDVAKQNYENIDESTISIVQEATKEEKYFIEYLWIVLGNYATANRLAVNILTPGAESIITKNENTGTKEEEKDESKTENTVKETFTGSGIKITVEGRYTNIADFVFDVENDKSLRFKLDNIQMIYTGDNKVKATFDVLSLSVLK